MSEFNFDPFSAKPIFTIFDRLFITRSYLINDRFEYFTNYEGNIFPRLKKDELTECFNSVKVTVFDGVNCYFLAIPLNYGRGKKALWIVETKAGSKEAVFLDHLIFAMENFTPIINTNFKQDYDLSIGQLKFNIFNLFFESIFIERDLVKPIYTTFRKISHFSKVKRIYLRPLDSQSKVFPSITWTHNNKEYDFPKGTYRLAGIFRSYPEYFTHNTMDDITFGLITEIKSIGFPSFICFPIKSSQKKVIGYLFFEIDIPEYEWSYNEIESYRMLSQLLSTTITEIEKDIYLERSEDVAKKIFDNQKNPFYTIDNSFKILYANKVMKSFSSNITEGEICYKAIANLDKQCPYCPLIRKSYQKNETFINNIQQWVELYSTKVYSDNQIEFHSIECVNITDKKRYEERLERNAFTDTIYNIKNRQCLLKDLELAFSKEGVNGTAIVIDINNLKFFNTTYSQTYGDSIIHKFVKLIKDKFGDANCYRNGGDKFVVILDSTPLDRATEKINELKMDLLNNNCVFTISCATISYPQDAPTLSKIIPTIDYMVDVCSSWGHNVLFNYSKDYVEIQRRKDLITDALKNAIFNKTFYVVYQPILDLKKGYYDKAEALLRLNDPVLGNISPAEFIPVAEQQGLINEIGYIVLETVCKSLNKIITEIPDFEAINVNISAIQLLSPSFVDDVKKLFEVFKINPKNINFELTETIFIDSYDKSREVIKQLSDFGIKFAIDDFGVGYSSLGYLVSLPIEIVKLDKMFIDQLFSHKKSNIFIKYVINLTKELSIHTVAEGVEIERQAQILKTLECDSIQGFLYSKPILIEELIHVLKERRFEHQGDQQIS